MDLGYVIHYVDNPADSARFYERAFGLKVSLVHDSGDFAQMETGSTGLAFTSHALGATAVPVRYRRSAPREMPSGYEITLLSPDVPAAFARAVEAGCEPLAAPEVTPWGQVVAYVRDTDGALVGLATPME